MEEKFARVEVCLAAYTLKQMKKSGRISAAAAFAGELLGLRPIISLNDGISHVEAKVRGDAAVPPAMLKWVHTRVEDMRIPPNWWRIPPPPPAAMSWSNCARRNSAMRRCAPSSWAAPVSANTGPDAVAVVFEGKPRRLCDYAPSLP